MRVKSTTIIFILLLLVFMAGCSGENADDFGEGADDSAYEYNADLYIPDSDDYCENAEASAAQPEFWECGLVWHVPPTLEHYIIRLCSCGNFFDDTGRQFDRQTGLFTDNFLHGHGGGPFGWVYDQELGLFGHRANAAVYGTSVGMHPLNQFEEAVKGMFGHDSWTLEWLLSTSYGLIAVQNVDFTKRVPYWDIDDDAWWLGEDAFLGQAALMYNREFITDFIFDEISQLQWYFNIRNDFEFVAARIGDRWGLIDKNGNTVIEFIFENLLLIDENTAFARYNGNYGILDFILTIENMNMEDDYDLQK
jgi:hypothetical protein